MIRLCKIFILILFFCIASLISAQQESGMILTTVVNSTNARHVPENQSTFSSPRFVTDTILTHSNFTEPLSADDVTPNNSIACIDELTGNHADNSYYRMFDLAAGATAGKPLTITNVVIGVQEVVGQQTIKVRLYTLRGTNFQIAYLNMIGSTDVTVLPQGAGAIDVPVFANVPANARLVVEVFTPSTQPLAPAASHFYIGSNTNPGNASASYLRSVACKLPQPTNLSQIEELPSGANVHLLMVVKGISSTSELFVNGSFEINSDGNTRPDSWGFNGPAGIDALLCKANRAYEGKCSWKILGSPFKRSIKQTVNMSSNPGQLNSVLVMNVMVASSSKDTRIQLKMKLLYANNTSDVASVTIEEVAGGNQYQALTLTKALNGPLHKVRAKIVLLPSSAGRVELVDYASLRLLP